MAAAPTKPRAYRAAPLLERHPSDLVPREFGEPHGPVRPGHDTGWATAGGRHGELRDRPRRRDARKLARVGFGEPEVAVRALCDRAERAAGSRAGQEWNLYATDSPEKVAAAFRRSGFPCGHRNPARLCLPLHLDVEGAARSQLFERRQLGALLLRLTQGQGRRLARVERHEPKRTGNRHHRWSTGIVPDPPYSNWAMLLSTRR